MLYKFKSRAAGDVIMLEPQGRQLLQIIGKGDSLAQGILLPADMPAAIRALEAAVQQEAQALEQKARAAQTLATPAAQATQATAQATTQDAARADNKEAVLLRQRAVPLIAMLKRCQAADKELVWGV